MPTPGSLCLPIHSVIRVDEYTAELGERVGLICREIRAVRWRGNSAQQMGRVRTGRVSRECGLVQLSVVAEVPVLQLFV